MDAHAVNRPEVIAEIRSIFLHYEAALLANDIATLNGYFWNSDSTVRYGIAEQSYGMDEIAAYRATAPRVDPRRQLRNTRIATFGSDMASICTEFYVPDTSINGRQTQTWVRFAEGWKIVAAHVSAPSVAP